MDIHRYDISDIINELPDIEPFSIETDFDLFICTLGFEDRTLKIIQELSKSKMCKETKIILIKYLTNVEDNLNNYDKFIDAASKMGDIVEVEYNRFCFPQELSNKLSSIITNSANVLFDISTCSSYVFYPTIKALLDYEINLSISYSEAGIYYPDIHEWEKVRKEAKLEENLFIEAFENAEFQSVGVNNIYPSQIFSEMNPGNKPNMLIAVPNFSAIRMNAIITHDKTLNKTSDKNIYWLIGEPPAQNNQWRMEAIQQTNNLSNIKNTNIKPVSTMYYKENIEALEDIYLNHCYNFSITIGTLGSKMQHLGTFFFLLMHQEVGLWLAEPKTFKSNRFSSGTGNIWYINFGQTKKLLKAISRYLTYEWKY